jgi:hypothetical protein
MTHEVIKHNYDRGLWNKAMVKTCVKKGIITQEQYRKIVGNVDTPAVV